MHSPIPVTAAPSRYQNLTIMSVSLTMRVLPCIRISLGCGERIRSLRLQQTVNIHGSVVGPEAFLLRFMDDENGDRLLVVNLGPDVSLRSVADPLIAPPADTTWQIIWSSGESSVWRSWHRPIRRQGMVYSRALGDGAVCLCGRWRIARAINNAQGYHSTRDD